MSTANTPPGSSGHPSGGQPAGFLDGLTRLLHTIGELADKGAELKESGLFETESGKQGRVNVGFSIRTAGTGQPGEGGLKVEPFGNVRRNRETGEAELAAVREPIVDVFDEEGEALRVVAELPGIDESQVTLRADGRTLVLEAEDGSKRYHAEVELPREVRVEEASISCNNGIAEITFS
ncbi:MAG: Hsp20/alpha crystallin family protein [Planctomycetota bacterium]